MCPPEVLSEAEKLRRLGELQRRLTGQRLGEDFVNGAQDTVLLRYLAARNYDVDKALSVRLRAPGAAKVLLRVPRAASGERRDAHTHAPRVARTRRPAHAAPALPRHAARA